MQCCTCSTSSVQVHCARSRSSPGAKCRHDDGPCPWSSNPSLDTSSERRAQRHRSKLMCCEPSSCSIAAPSTEARCGSCTPDALCPVPARKRCVAEYFGRFRKRERGRGRRRSNVGFCTTSSRENCNSCRLAPLVPSLQ